MSDGEARQLREMHRKFADHVPDVVQLAMLEAANAIERIARERELCRQKLIVEGDRYRVLESDLETWQCRENHQMNRAIAAEDRIAELEAALLWYADFDGVDAGHRARAILNKGKPP
ncbi:MAG: hypothetical protein ABW191_07250 [Aliihoeflea sp.]